MKKEKIINISIIILCIVIFFSVYGYWSSKRYEKQKIFFVNSCVDTFYYDGAHNFNDLVDEFSRKLPSNTYTFIGREFGYDYIAEIETDNIEVFCENIYDFYREDLGEAEYDYCEEYRCK